MNNPLLDHDFLTKLMEHRHREVYARIILLNKEELPISQLEGKVTGGSINVDGTSALRRTCNLTMVLWNQQEINQFNWTFKSKFKLEIGLKNMIEPKYSDIIWFKQGVFILTTCNMNQITNNYTITINGKDKMCLLNGDIAGAIPHSTDFGVEEYYDKVTNEVTYNKILLKDIIRNAVQVFGGELSQNIIINDLDDAGLELLEYRNENEPLYLYRRVEDGSINQVTLDGNTKVLQKSTREEIEISKVPIYATSSNLMSDTAPTVILWGENNDEDYHIMKFEYGDLAGYRLTDLTFAGDLKANVGETLVSILDKIKNMLGHFEYFYNLDGKFVFQKKRTYVSTPWGNQENNIEDIVNPLIEDAYPKINLRNAQLTTAFANNPNLLNVKNDFSVWGTYKSISGADIPIHMRYALDNKPTYYKSLEGVEYTSETWDWREIIYQMAVDYYKHWTEDDFLLNVAAANPNHYPTGKTGYEQYYTDIQGFWRQLYDPNPEATYYEVSSDEASQLLKDEEELYLEDYYELIAKDKVYDLDKKKRLLGLEELYVVSIITANGKEKNVFYPFLKSEYCCLKNNEIYWYKDVQGVWQSVKSGNDSGNTLLNAKPLDSIYFERTADDDTKIQLVEDRFMNYLNNGDNYFWIKKTGERKKFSELNPSFRAACKGTVAEKIDSIKNVAQYITSWKIIDNFGTYATSENTDGKPQEITERVAYFKEDSNGEYSSETYWNEGVENAPDQLIFWFDFLETEGSDLYKYSVKEIGTRSKAINDTNVKSIYYRDVPNVIFSLDSDLQRFERKPGYTYIHLPKSHEALFSISGRGKSAKERVDELLQEHSYAIEQTNITTVPLYHLEPNTRISVFDEKSKVDGEYDITKITIPLAYNGTMSLSTSKVVSNII